MRFGVYLPNEGPFADVRELAALAAAAEAAGWDGFFIWDALLPSTSTPTGSARRWAPRATWPMSPSP